MFSSRQRQCCLAIEKFAKKSHGQSGSSKGYQKDHFLKARGKRQSRFRIPPPESAGRLRGWFQKGRRKVQGKLHTLLMNSVNHVSIDTFL